MPGNVKIAQLIAFSDNIETQQGSIVNGKDDLLKDSNKQ